MSTSRGNEENIKLKQNIEGQLNRLLTQLKDLEDMKDELDEEEYISGRQETLDQMKEFEKSLQKLLDGNITLIDDFGSVQLAIQSAIKSTFKSPEVLEMLAKKESTGLKGKLNLLEQDYKLGRINHDAYTSIASEIILALEKLGEPLTVLQKEIFKASNLSTGEVVTSDIGEKIYQSAKVEIKNTKQ